MTAPIKVVVVGATGETGAEIVKGLLESSTNYEITAIVRASSANKPEVGELEDKGVKVAVADLDGPKDALVEILRGVDVVVSAVYFMALDDQIPLIDAARAAGVERFVPCNFQPTVPPAGVMYMREKKEEIINYAKKSGIGYTVIDVAWWHQLLVTKLPSGRTDVDTHGLLDARMPGDGTVPIALADRRNIGVHVARILADPRTLNKYVYIYDDVKTANEIWDELDRASGEKCERKYVSEKELLDMAEKGLAVLKRDPSNVMEGHFPAITAQYRLSWGIRGDSTPEFAKYLGYLDSNELYPDITPMRLATYWEDVLAGKARHWRK